MADRPEVKQRVLAIGDPGMAKNIYPDADIDLMESNSLKIISRFRSIRYDAIVSYLALPRVHYRRAQKAISEWRDALKDGGSLHIFVPSLEWAARMILSEEPTKALHGVLYGGEVPNNYMSGYTMMDLRNLCELSGLQAIYARVGTYQIQEGENIHDCDTNYVMAIKPKV